MVTQARRNEFGSHYWSLRDKQGPGTGGFVVTGSPGSESAHGRTPTVTASDERALAMLSRGCLGVQLQGSCMAGCGQESCIHGPALLCSLCDLRPLTCLLWASAFRKVIRLDWVILESFLVLDIL